MKNNKTKTVRTSNAAAPVCVCSRGHRVWSAVALIGLFLCGLMIGLPIGAKHGASQSTAASAQTERSKYSLAMDPNSDMRPCERIEVLLTDRLEQVGDYKDAMYNANTYASMVEYGCPENAEQNRQLALDALQVADALSSGYIAENTNDTEIVIDTYKKLEMQTQAREFLNKVQKLTDPAIDFILQMEKIINE